MNATRYDYDPDNIIGLTHAGDGVMERGRYVTEADYLRDIAKLEQERNDWRNSSDNHLALRESDAQAVRLAQLDKILAPTFKIVGDNWMCTNSKSDPLCLYCGERWDNHYVDKEDDTESCIVPKLMALYIPTP